MVVVLPVPLTPTTSTTAGLSGDGRARVPDEVARDQKRRQLGADGRLGSTRRAAAPGAVDELDRQRGADVAGDERLLDVVPRRPLGAVGDEGAAQSRHEAAPGALQPGIECGGGVWSRDRRRGDRLGLADRLGPGGRRGSAGVSGVGISMVTTDGGAGSNGKTRIRGGLGRRLRGVGRVGRVLEVGGIRLPGRIDEVGIDRFVDLALGGCSFSVASPEGHGREAYPASAVRSRSRAASACASSSRRLMTRLTESSPTVTP